MRRSREESILISDKVDFEHKFVRRDKIGHIILTKGAILQEQKTIINLYVPNVCHPTSLNIYN
jgi:hypothetical protein